VICPNCAHEFTQARLTPRPLTRYQRAIYDYIRWHIADLGYAPSFAEIAGHFGYASLATVHEHLGTLAQKGWIVRRYNEARSIALTQEAA
jgi:SOS-response transcriptional repressor LexA